MTAASGSLEAAEAAATEAAEAEAAAADAAAAADVVLLAPDALAAAAAAAEALHVASNNIIALHVPHAKMAQKLHGPSGTAATGWPMREVH